MARNREGRRNSFGPDSYGPIRGAAVRLLLAIVPMVSRYVMSARIASGFALAALLVAGCGSGDSESAETTTAGSSSAGAPTTEKKNAAVTVTVSDMEFSPAEITVNAGDTVTWKFSDRFPHNVQGMGDKAMGINSPIMNTGEWSYTFTAPGTFRYICSLHPQMRGTVTVK